MTREAFIRKWLGNPQKQYNEQCRDEMRDDFDLVIEAALRQPLVMLSLPTVKEIEAWAKEQAKIEPTGAEEFGRIWGAMWMRGLIEQKLKGNGA